MHRELLFPAGLVTVDFISLWCTYYMWGGDVPPAERCAGVTAAVSVWGWGGLQPQHLAALRLCFMFGGSCVLLNHVLVAFNLGR